MLKPASVTIISPMSLPTKNFLLYTEKMMVVSEFILKISQFIYSNDAVHLIKNIRTNLLHQKRLIFPQFSSVHLGDKQVEVIGGEISWSLHYKVWEKDIIV